MNLPRPPRFEKVRGLMEHFLRIQQVIEQWANRVITNDADIDIRNSLNVQGSLTVVGDTVLATETPASASASGTTGQIAWDASYLYVCTATDTWKRVAISTW